MSQSVEAWQSFWNEGEMGEIDEVATIEAGSVAARALIPYASSSDQDYPDKVVVPTGERANLPA